MSILSAISAAAQQEVYTTQGNIAITRHSEPIPVKDAKEIVLSKLDYRKGALFSSGYEFPGRYSRWDIGFINPALQLKANRTSFSIIAENARGTVLLEPIRRILKSSTDVENFSESPNELSGNIKASVSVLNEEERTTQSSIFTIIRSIRELFRSPNDSFLGLYGAFGYDLVFQFEPMELKHHRAENQSDVILYLPDEIIVVDHSKDAAFQLSYEFSFEGSSTEGMERTGTSQEPMLNGKIPEDGYTPGKYAELVEEARKSFKAGDMFEAVPTHTLYEQCSSMPSAIFSRLEKINPSPYGFIINLGGEFLVGSSPEMYVRVEGSRVETSPISGTIKRGSNAIEDAFQIRELLNSAKDESELTMCTDVDRNDKSRICEPGTVQVIGRRQIEMYSHLIHTVDHVEGRLRPEYDALDAFMTHMWAVTITGAPKRAAIQWIEEHESSQRNWYGGSVGYLSFDGNLNTGLTLRTIHIRNGVAEIRVGATCLYDSVPEDEEQETLTKAAVLVGAVRGTERAGLGRPASQQRSGAGQGKRILLVDHEDSFVHTLANYMKQTGAEVTTMRAPHARDVLQASSGFDMVVLSPGPGRPSQFALNETIALCVEKNIPLFGVCLGLQGIVEYFGGALNLLDYPQHGKISLVHTTGSSRMWDGMPSEFHVGRYHSLYAQIVPDCLSVTAMSEDGIVMAVEHVSLPIAAVQFHPESIATLRGEAGIAIIENMITHLIK
ncbi:anthranilate synthase component I [Paenibacillus oenotherae]|uniref:Anthranilate synthase n=1 Tax=Paenibacillus oenotherae TaxID=1435645 RepID=A0ABS7D5F9_9BACL|nr:anthranilate synthase component I [Paenibacillus oenotherae]MBW7475187.1 anthranilate synthase component I [Paenibacillus oenotherae]